MPGRPTVTYHVITVAAVRGEFWGFPLRVLDCDGVALSSPHALEYRWLSAVQSR